MRLAFLTASASRRAGGILPALSGLTRSLAARADVRVFAAEDRFSHEDLGVWDPVVPTLFRVRGPRSFGYAAGVAEAVAASDPDLVHTHGLWMYPSVVARRWQGRSSRPLVVSPHGMLDAWALRNRALKKRVALLLYERSHLDRAACLHALTESEAASLRALGLRNPICVVPNGIEVPEQGPTLPPPWYARVPRGARVLAFLGRFHPKKGLADLLLAWGEVRREARAAAEPWHLVLAGWDQGGHRRELESLARPAGAGPSVHFLGALHGAAKTSFLRHADAFVLPSRSEGLPISVLEAWAHGLPVLMTPECNLRVGYEAGAALRIGSRCPEIAAGLRELFRLSDAERAAVGAAGRRLVERDFSWPRLADRMLSVYRWVCHRSDVPPFVSAA